MKNRTYFKISLIYFVAICLVAIVFVFGHMGLIENEFISSFLIQIVVMFAIPLLMYSLLMRKNLKQTFADTGFKKISTNMFFITIGLGFILYFLNQFVATIFQSIISLFGYETISSSTKVILDYKFLLKELILSCILPGFCEEFLHRGIMLHAGKKSTNPRYCLIISSILFGLMHLNINQFFYAAILGYLIGLVGVVSNSIYPCMIIHFMNNFLGSFIYYGSKLNWPIASIITKLTNLIYTNPLIFIITAIIGIPALFYAYKFLVKNLSKERTKMKMQAIIKELKMNNLTIEEAQAKINIVNSVLAQKHFNQIQNVHKSKLKFSEKIFIISSIILGTLITISSFIWGIL